MIIIYDRTPNMGRTVCHALFHALFHALPHTLSHAMEPVTTCCGTSVTSAYCIYILHAQNPIRRMYVSVCVIVTGFIAVCVCANLIGRCCKARVGAPICYANGWDRKGDKTVETLEHSLKTLNKPGTLGRTCCFLAMTVPTVEQL